MMKSLEMSISKKNAFTSEKVRQIWTFDQRKTELCARNQGNSRTTWRESHTHWFELILVVVDVVAAAVVVAVVVVVGRHSRYWKTFFNERTKHDKEALFISLQMSTKCFKFVALWADRGYWLQCLRGRFLQYKFPWKFNWRFHE